MNISSRLRNMTLTSPRALVFGINGGIGRLMTSTTLSRSWNVTSVIRSPDQDASIRKLAKGQEQKANLDVLVSDLEDMTLEVANGIVKERKPDYVVFAAGNMGRVNRVDRDAAKSIIKASTATNSLVTKFLMMFFPASRRKRAPWWDNKDFQHFQSERSSYPEIGQAKLDSDECLVAMAHEREVKGGPKFQAISLRPSWLTDSPTGKVQLGKTKTLGRVARGDVAEVAVELLSGDDTDGWFDLLQGSDGISDAVEKIVRDRINTIESDDVEVIYRLAD